MAQVTINHEDLSLNLKKDQSIGDVMNKLCDEILKDSEIITSIHINGQELSQSEENGLLPKQASSFESINFTVKTSSELAFEALDSCSSYIDVVIAKIHELGRLYAAGEIQLANNLFSEVIEIMDLFIQLVTKIHSTFRTNLGDKFVKTETLQTLEIHLLSILKGLVPAKEKNDIVMLCDLLEYELVENLTQWKIKAIPELKSLKRIV